MFRVGPATPHLPLHLPCQVRTDRARIEELEPAVVVLHDDLKAETRARRRAEARAKLSVPLELLRDRGKVWKKMQQAFHPDNILEDDLKEIATEFLKEVNQACPAERSSGHEDP